MLKLRGDRCSQIISGVFTVLLKVAVLQRKDQGWQWEVEDLGQQIFCRAANFERHQRCSPQHEQ